MLEWKCLVTLRNKPCSGVSRDRSHNLEEIKAVIKVVKKVILLYIDIIKKNNFNDFHLFSVLARPILNTPLYKIVDYSYMSEYNLTLT